MILHFDKKWCGILYKWWYKCTTLFDFINWLSQWAMIIISILICNSAHLHSRDGDSICVMIRIRPPIADSNEDTCLDVDHAKNAICMHSKPDPKKFTFDQVADENTSQVIWYLTEEPCCFCLTSLNDRFALCLTHKSRKSFSYGFVLLTYTWNIINCILANYYHVVIFSLLINLLACTRQLHLSFQETIFTSVGKRVVESCMSGYNGTIFA